MVVKVQRPDIDVTVKADLNVLRDLTHVLERRFEWARDSDLSGIMDEYAKNVAIELDYTTEALNNRYLAANLKDFPEVQIPAIYDQLSTARVLTQEFVEGVEISQTEQLDAAGVDRPALARGLVRAMIKQVLFDGFFHGDPHPGNVLVNTETSRLIFLDLGMVGTLTKDKRVALADLIWSLQEGDAHAVGRVALSLTKRFKEVDEAKFIQDIELVLKRWFALGFEGVTLSACVKALFGAIYAHGLRLDPDMTLALKALLLTESSVAGLDPTLRLLPTAFEESKSLLVAQFDPEKIEQALKREMIRGAKEVVRHIPEIQDAVVVWLDHLRRGRFTLQVDASEVSQQIRELDQTLTSNIKRLLLGMLLIGLLVGSGIASTVDTPELPGLSMIAYYIFVASAIVTGVIVISMIWRWLNDGRL